MTIPNYDISFKQPDNKFKLSADLLSIAQSLQPLVIDFKREYRTHPREFLFSQLRSYVYNDFGPNSKIDVEYLYKLKSGKNVALNENEKSFCAIVVTMFKNCKNKDDFNNSISKVFELTVASVFGNEYGIDSVRENVKVLVNGVQIKNESKIEIDLAVDQLQAKDLLILCECCLSIFGFKNKEKSGQIGLYYEIIKAIREAGYKKIEIIFEMSAPFEGNDSWEDINLSRIQDFNRFNTKVVGKNVFSQDIHIFSGH